MTTHRYSLATAGTFAAGAAAVIATFAFSQGTAQSIIFAVLIAAAVASAGVLVNVPDERRRTHRALGAATLVAAAWTILVSLGIFSGSAQYWIAFGGGTAIVALSTVARTLHHRALERRAGLAELRPVTGASSRAA
jgi:hypothetical protein